MTCGVAGCGRPIVRGFYLPWVHLTNPGRDHHYARPASRSAAHSDLAGASALRSRDEDQPSSEAPDVGQALSAAAPSLPLPPGDDGAHSNPSIWQLDQSGEPSTAVAVVPLRARVRSDGSPESPRGTHRQVAG